MTMIEFLYKKWRRFAKPKIKFVKNKYFNELYWLKDKYGFTWICERRNFLYSKRKRSNFIYQHFDICQYFRTIFIYNDTFSTFRNIFFIGKLFYKPWFYYTYKQMFPIFFFLLIWFFLMMILRCKINKSKLAYKVSILFIFNILDFFFFYLFLLCIFINCAEFHRFFYLLSGFLCLKRAHKLLNLALDYNNNPKKPFCPRRMFTNHLFPMFVWSIFIYYFFKFYTKIGCMDFLQIIYNGHILFNPNKYCNRYENLMWWIHVRQRIRYFD